MQTEVLVVIVSSVSSVILSIVSCMVWLFKRAILKTDIILKDIEKIKLTIARIDGKIASQPEMQKQILDNEKKLILVESKASAAHKRIDLILNKA